MKSKLCLSLGMLLGVSATAAQAQQWNDAVQWEDNNVRAPFYSTPPTTNMGVYIFSGSCSPPDKFQPFTAPNITPGPNNVFGPTNCAYSGSMFIDLNQFARQNDVASMQAEVSQLNQAAHLASIRADQGIAMSFAMAGTANLQPGEHVALSANWGTFQGQNGGAVSMAVKLSDHVSINGGVARSFEGSSTGGRAGVRIGW
jgi:hypothetical protein